MLLVSLVSHSLAVSLRSESHQAEVRCWPAMQPSWCGSLSAHEDDWQISFPCSCQLKVPFAWWLSAGPLSALRGHPWAVCCLTTTIISWTRTFFVPFYFTTRSPFSLIRAMHRTMGVTFPTSLLSKSWRAKAETPARSADKNLEAILEFYLF